jgi:hypothetical protein
MGLFARKPARMPLDERTLTLSAAELDNVLFTVGGSYAAWVDEALVRETRTVFTKHLKLGPYPDSWTGTAYLEADRKTPGRVWVSIDGRRVSQLTDTAAALLDGRLDGPVPVKATAMIVGVTRLPSLSLSPRKH